jgi:hypothetical protein
MRHAALLLGAILIFAFNVHGQVNPNYSLPEVSLVHDSDTLGMTALPAGALPPLASALPSDAPGSSSLGGGQMGPRGVFQIYSFQIYADYSFFRFYVASKPNLTVNMNGLDFGLNYFPGANWIGIEGQFAAQFGSLLHQGSKFAMALGGARARWAAPRGVEVWGHALVGYTKFIPQTALGGQNAFAFEVGGGVDLGSHRNRFRIRVGGDLVGTRYFSTYQYSPRISVGLVYNYR